MSHDLWHQQVDWKHMADWDLSAGRCHLRSEQGPQMPASTGLSLRVKFLQKERHLVPSLDEVDRAGMCWARQYLGAEHGWLLPFDRSVSVPMFSLFCWSFCSAAVSGPASLRPRLWKWRRRGGQLQEWEAGLAGLPQALNHAVFSPVALSHVQRDVVVKLPVAQISCCLSASPSVGTWASSLLSC